MCLLFLSICQVWIIWGNNVSLKLALNYKNVIQIHEVEFLSLEFTQIVFKIGNPFRFHVVWVNIVNAISATEILAIILYFFIVLWKTRTRYFLTAEHESIPSAIMLWFKVTWFFGSNDRCSWSYSIYSHYFINAYGINYQ